MENPYLDTVKQTVAEVFGCDPGTLTDEMGPGDIPQWDSLGHIMLLEALSARAEREFPLEQAIEAKNIRGLAELLERG